MTSTKYRVLFWFFSIFLAFSLFVLSIVFVLASPTHNIGSQIGVNYEAPVSVNLNFVNNTGSDVISDAYEIKYNEDITQFYIDGIVPSSTTYQDGSIINDKGQEFYYFSNVPQDMDGNVIGNAGEGSAAASTQQSSGNVTLSEGVLTLEDSFVNIPENKNILAKRYYPSSSTDPIWYDLPEADIELYSTFLTPNCTDGTDATIGTNTDIVISHQVTSIPNDAFRGSSSTPGVVTSVVIPNGITSIGSYAFSYNYTLSNVVLPSTLTRINTYAFYYCYGLTNITVPQKVSSIGSWAFNYDYKLIEVNNLSSLNISTNNSYGFVGYYAEEVFDSINYDSKLKLYGDGVVMYENIDDSLYYAMGFVGGKGASVILPTTSYDYDIYNYAFYYNDNIVSVEISNSVTSIGEEAFYNCGSLTSIIIPESVTSIGGYAFYNCSNILELRIDNLTSYLNISYGYSSSPLYSTSQAVSLYVGGEHITDLVIPEGVTIIPEYAFRRVNITGVTIPSLVTSIGSYAFRYCSNLESINLPEGINAINNYTFYGCSSLTNITIPESVTSIGGAAFYDCSSLTSITIPEGVTSIGVNAFQYCSNLESINLPEGINAINNYTFYGCSSLTNITIPESVTSIGSYAFYNCSNLESINLPEGITVINNYTFYGCSSLTNITIPESVTSIRERAFYDCSNLASIIVPSGVTSIGEYAFSGCSSIETVNFGENSMLTSIGYHAFSSCSSLTSITIPESVTSIEASAFNSCSSLTFITIPSGVTSIGNYAFENCSSLTIYSEANSQPSGWDYYWNSSHCPEYWGLNVNWEYDEVTGEPRPISGRDHNGVSSGG